VEGYKEAIVLLLGPLPGIALGLVLGAVCMFYDSAALRSAATMLVSINGFNLLPLMPLDGGRVLHLIIFSRQRHIEALFRVGTAALLGLLALGIGAWALGIFAVLLLIGTPSTFKVATLAQQLRGAFQFSAETNPSAPLSHELAVALIERVRAAFPQVLQPQALANFARQVWERIHLQPPGIVSSVLLLGVFGATILVTPIAFIVFTVAPIPSIVTAKHAKGEAGQIQQVRVWGRLRSSTELGADGEPHGRFVEYYPYSDQVRIEGAFAGGLQDGTWTTYRQDGQVESREEFRLGEPIKPLPPAA
jgi:hypothetical protein